MTAPAELARRLDNLIRLGTVAEVDHAVARCRVQAGRLLTDWLPWMAPRAGDTLEWHPPTIGEQVVILCPSGEPAAGVVLTGLYTTAHDQPGTSPNEHLTVYPDGATIVYNHATGALNVAGIRTATVEASEHVTVDCPDSTITGNVLIQGTLTVEDLLTYQNGLAGSGGTAGNGNTITGELTHIGGNLSSNGVVLHTHTHPDPGTGGPA